MATSSQTLHWVGVNNAYDLLLALSDPDADERRFSDHHTRADVAEALSIIDREANELRDDESLKDYDVPGVIDALWRKFTPMLAVDQWNDHLCNGDALSIHDRYERIIREREQYRREAGDDKGLRAGRR